MGPGGLGDSHDCNYDRLGLGRPKWRRLGPQPTRANAPSRGRITARACNAGLDPAVEWTLSLTSTTKKWSIVLISFVQA